jgi:signal transduction histidine kinase
LQARPEWGREGLRGTILRLAVDAARSLGFEPAVRFHGDLEGVPAEVADQLVPTLREALSNAARHARATRVDVELEVGDDVLLRVVDDGVGLPDDAEAGGGSGLRNLRERAQRLGGTCTATTAPAGIGTLLRWCVPGRPRA